MELIKAPRAEMTGLHLFDLPVGLDNADMRLTGICQKQFCRFSATKISVLVGILGSKLGILVDFGLGQQGGPKMAIFVLKNGFFEGVGRNARKPSWGICLRVA